MSNKLFMTAQEVVDTLGMSKAYACKLIQKMNQEMVKGGYIQRSKTSVQKNGSIY